MRQQIILFFSAIVIVLGLISSCAAPKPVSTKEAELLAHEALIDAIKQGKLNIDTTHLVVTQQPQQFDKLMVVGYWDSTAKLSISVTVYPNRETEIRTKSYKDEEEPFKIVQ